MSVEVTIANEGDINRLLQSLPTEIFDQVEQLLTSGALRLSERARDLVPIRTGHLLESITPVFGEEVEDPDSDGSPRAFDPVQVIADTPYASFVEFGTSKMAAQPFLGPAAQELEPEFFAGIDAILEGLGLERTDEGEMLGP